MVQATIHALDDSKHVTVDYTGVISLELFNPSYWEQVLRKLLVLGWKRCRLS